MAYSGSVEALLGLYSIPSIGAAKMRKLISVFGTAEDVLSASERRLMEIEGVDRRTIEHIKRGVDKDFIEEQTKLIDAHNVHLLTYWDEHYPARLKGIYDPPAFLFAKGDMACLDIPSFAVVGTRHPTGYGRMITERFSRELVQNGFVIISGLARGIDTLAHKTALQSGGKTIAVLGNGLDRIYPSENRKIYQQITENGLLVSEYPMGTNPDAGNFPKRNRIISGISSGVLITEAGDKSGALLTAYYAADQNREVFAVPGSIVSGKSTGTNNLIKSGAKLVACIEDILEELQGQLNLSMPKNKTKRVLPELSGTEKTVYDLLGSEPQHVDQIAIRLGLSPSETLSSLLTLELMGAIRQMAGKMFVRI